MTFEEALKRLEDIVGRLESGELSLDASMSLFEEGVQMAHACQKLLAEAEGKVERLLADGAVEPLQDLA